MRSMRLRKHAAGSRIRLRTDDFVELPRNYADKVVYSADEATEDAVEDADEDLLGGLDSETSTDFEFDISMPSTDEETGSEDGTTAGASGSAIPELDLNELIILANQLVRNSPPSMTTASAAAGSDNRGATGASAGEGGVANVHIRFPLIRTISEARDVIMQYERLNGRHTRNGGEDAAGTFPALPHGDIVWDSIVQDYSGISISGTRAYNSSAAAQTSNAGTGAGANAGANVNVNLNNNMNVENMHRQPVWLELAGLATVTMFMFAVYRLVTNLVSISAFSENVVGDVVTFVEYVNDKTYYKHVAHPLDNTSLIYKFGLVIKREMPYLPDTLWLVLTVLAFSAYTVLTSGVVLTSMLFATMCLTMCVVLRWRHLGDFILRVVDNGERCL